MRKRVHTYSKSGSKTNNYTAKQYCLGSQTLVFRAANNIVSSVEVNYSEDETLVLHF